jgi:putative ABC transport system ATP-binding protein
MTAPIRHQPNYLPPPDRCTGQPLIEMAQIVKTFKNASGEFTALKGVTACFYPGEFVSVVGKSGSGKSTLVNMLTGIDHPTSGTVRVGDTYVHSLSENDMSVWRGKNLGIVFQFFQLLPTLTLLENVMLPMYLSGLYTPAGREARAMELLTLVGLEKLVDKLPAAVSGGQQQSAAIARALANDPPILIADEPTGNLDSRTADEVFDLFAGLIDQGKSILMVTHDIGLARRTTRTLLISDGEIINPWVAGALHHVGHSQMLWLTHHLKPKMLLPGENFRLASNEADWLLLVTGGRLEMMAKSHNGSGSRPPIVGLGSGSFVSSQDLTTDSWAGSSIRASLDEPAEVLLVEGPDFQRWLDETPAARTSLQQAAFNQRAGWPHQPLPEAI